MERLRSAAVLLVALFVATAASAASFIVPSDRELVRAAKAIVIAKAVTSYVVPGDGEMIYTVNEMDVEEVIKGNISSSRIQIVEEPRRLSRDEFIRDVQHATIAHRVELIPAGSILEPIQPGDRVAHFPDQDNLRIAFDDLFLAHLGKLQFGVVEQVSAAGDIEHLADHCVRAGRHEGIIGEDQQDSRPPLDGNRGDALADGLAASLEWTILASLATRPSRQGFSSL